MPIPIIILYLLVVCSFLVDQLSAFYDSHWAIAEFSFRDPWHIGITAFWGIVIIYILKGIKNKDRSIPKTFLYVGIVSAVFMVSEISDDDQQGLAVLSSFQALEVIIWFVCYGMCLSCRAIKAWFSPDINKDHAA